MCAQDKTAHTTKLTVESESTFQFFQDMVYYCLGRIMVRKPLILKAIPVWMISYIFLFTTHAVGSTIDNSAYVQNHPHPLISRALTGVSPAQGRDLHGLDSDAHHLPLPEICF